MKCLLTVLLFMIQYRALAVTDTIPVYYTSLEMPSALKGQYYGQFDPYVLAQDLAGLFKQATGKEYKPVAGTRGRKSGIILEIDSSLQGYQPEEGRLESDGKNKTIIRARYANGLSYALYSWLKDLGFRFYLPGERWSVIPAMAGPHSKKMLKKTYKPAFRMRMFLASGGTYAVRGLDPDKQMEKDWHLWHQRNRMGCSYIVIDGHAGESFNLANRKRIEEDSLILAPVNGKRQFRVDGKLDPTYSAGVSLFAEWVANRHREQSAKWPWFLPAKSFTSADAGDGLNYCHTPACEKEFRTVSDQSFYMVNQAAKAIRQLGKSGGASTLAYTERADTPGIRIEPNVHVMVVPSAFQQVTTAADLMLRWVKKAGHVSQYDYLNIGVWNWDQPFFNLYDYHAYLTFLRKLRVEGLHYEASFSALASGIQQYFILRYLCEPYQDIDTVLDEFCTSSFGRAAPPMKKLLKEWYFSSTHLKTNYDHPVMYPDELGRSFQYLDEAVSSGGISESSRNRIREFSQYNTYLCQYYELFSDPDKLESYTRNPALKQEAVKNILAYTWQLYDTRIFHNTQLNDLYKKMLPEADQAVWDYRQSTRFEQFRRANPDEPEETIARYRQHYLPRSAPMPPVSDKELDKLVAYGADSIRIATMDETAFINFMYPLSLYARGPGNLTIRFQVSESMQPDRQQQKTGIISLEKNDYSYIKTEIIRTGQQSGLVQFKLPARGRYRLYLSQYQATHIDYIIYPGDQLFYHAKKSILMNGLRMQEPAAPGSYPNRMIGLYAPGTNTKSFAMMYASSTNNARFFDPEGMKLATGKKNGSSEYLVSGFHLPENRPFIFYENQVYRWPPVLLDGPAMYLFLRYPAKKRGS